MGLYNFQPRFVRFIQDGTKTHTIRAPRAVREKPGNTVHCYIGLRHKAVEVIGRFPFLRMQDIVIDADCAVVVDGAELSRDERNRLAFVDGFRSRPDGEHFLEMLAFWAGRLPFRGDIIHWQYSKAAVDAACKEAEQRAQARAIAIIPRTGVEARTLTKAGQ